jgi:dihydroneopterin triphosphate diphosphatase
MVVPVRMGRDWEVLVLRRPPAKGGIWAPVTGNVDAGESFEEAAVRELEEETGLAEAAALLPTGLVNRFEKERGGKLERFEEPVFAAVVRPGTPVRLSEEHVEYRWVSSNEAEQLVAFDGCKAGVRGALEALEKRVT